MSAARSVWLREATVPQERLACGRTRVLAAMHEATVVPVGNTSMKSKASAVIERSERSQRSQRAGLLRGGYEPSTSLSTVQNSFSVPQKGDRHGPAHRDPFILEGFCNAKNICTTPIDRNDAQTRRPDAAVLIKRRKWGATFRTGFLDCTGFYP